mgnify:CR=1 FL=1
MEGSIIRKSKQLTKQQSHIVGSNEYPMYLRAGAGTGKTEVLVQKILHILKSEPNVSLSNFAIITFTNKAAKEMKERVIKLIGSSANSIQISTFHSLGLKIIVTSPVYPFCIILGIVVTCAITIVANTREINNVIFLISL